MQVLLGLKIWDLGESCSELERVEVVVLRMGCKKKKKAKKKKKSYTMVLLGAGDKTLSPH